MARMAIRCTPVANPINNEIKINQRLALSRSASSSHLHPNQTMMAVKSEAMAYTSPSTAENQKESLNMNTDAPTIPLPNAIIDCDLDKETLCASGAGSPTLVEKNILRIKCVIVQKRNIMVSALQIADMELIASAYLLPSPNANPAHTAPISWKSAAPGACVTPNLAEETMYS